MCDVSGSIDPSNLNYPSIAVGDLAGKQTVTRTVTNTTNQASVYVAKVQAPPGFTVKVTPSMLTVLPRQVGDYKVEFTRTSARARSTFAFGSLTWPDLRGHRVRSPISVVRAAGSRRPVVNGGHQRLHRLKVRAGFAGVLTAQPFGLVASDVRTRATWPAPTHGKFDHELRLRRTRWSQSSSVTVPGRHQAGPRFSSLPVTIRPGTDSISVRLPGDRRRSAPVASAGAGSRQEPSRSPGREPATSYVVLYASMPAS